MDAVYDAIKMARYNRTITADNFRAMLLQLLGGSRDQSRIIEICGNLADLCGSKDRERYTDLPKMLGEWAADNYVETVADGKSVDNLMFLADQIRKAA